MTISHRSLPLFLAPFLLALLADARKAPTTEPFARAALQPKSNTQASATVEFIKSPTSVLVRVHPDHLGKGTYGFHIHEKGNCEAPDASSAGGHFNPLEHKHGGTTGAERHVGDLGNLVITSDRGEPVEIRIPNPTGKKAPSWDAIVGKSVVLHEGPDDLKSDPAGNSGARIACGVIEAVSAEKK